MPNIFTPEQEAMFRKHDQSVDEFIEFWKEHPRAGLGVGGRILESHEENGVTIIDSWEIAEVSIVFDSPDYPYAMIYRPSLVDKVIDRIPLWLLIVLVTLESITALVLLVRMIWSG